ncbi:MAG: DMT family transporter [Proteobacteria bacterium]|nr:DMT family transporter [Pseudomonadota bacterium]
MKYTPAALGMILAGVSYLFFTIFDSFTKLAAKNISVPEIMAVELLSAALFLAGVAWVEDRKNFRRDMQFHKKGLHLLRGVLNAISNTFFFFGFTHMQLAEYYVILFLIPIWVALMSGWMLREKPSLQLILSVLVSFAGVLVAMRPGQGMSPLAVLVLCGTFTNATALIVLRKMTKTETTKAMSVSVCFVMGMWSLILTPFMFKIPGLQDVLYMVAGGLCFGVAQRFLIKGTALAPVALAGAAQFLQLVYGAAIGYMVFGDVPSVWIYAGGMVVVAANLYLLWTQNREVKPA